MDGVLQTSVGRLADRVAERTTAPGAGGVAAVSTTLAAALATMAARFSDDEAGIEHCSALRAQAEPLADADADAYGAYLEALRLPRDDVDQSAAVSAARDRAVDVPLQIASVAADVAEAAARIARDGNPRLRGDAATASVIAAAACASAATLVGLNVGDPHEPRAVHAAALAQRAKEEAALATEAATRS